LGVGDIDLEWGCFFDEAGETLISSREVFFCRGEIKRNREGGATHG
jgi:hypothetical protein